MRAGDATGWGGAAPLTAHPKANWGAEPSEWGMPGASVSRIDSARLNANTINRGRQILRG